MKKIIVIVLIMITLFTLTKKSNEVLIPDEAIRFRVIANSDTTIDQETKINIKEELEKNIFEDLKDKKSLYETRSTLTNNLSKYEQLVENNLSNNQKFSINYGINHFPEKEYKGVKYKEGEYESLVVTLGEGKGKNWWCVLFPPLCLLDAKETKEKEKVEYKFFVKELIEKYFK